MSVRKPISRPSIEHLVSKGASVKEDTISEKKYRVHINLAIPPKLLEEVDYILKDRVGISRTGWILEAMQEKVKAGK